MNVLKQGSGATKILQSTVYVIVERQYMTNSPHDRHT